jgi:hypothetical protein
MIEKTSRICSPELIEKALVEHPITEESTVLNEPTGDFFYNVWRIKDIYKNTIWEEVLNTLPYPLGQVRIIKLEPGESYVAHADIDNRWHLNLTGIQSYLIDLDSKTMHETTRDGYWYYMNAGNIHAATNYGSIPRLQLVARELLRIPHTSVDLVSVTIGPAYEQYDFRYKFDNILSPWLNKINREYKMLDFAHNAATVKLKIEKECIAELEAITTSDFKISYD